MGNMCVVETTERINQDQVVSLKTRTKARKQRARNAKEITEDIAYEKIFDRNILDPYVNQYADHQSAIRSIPPGFLDDEMSESQAIYEKQGDSIFEGDEAKERMPFIEFGEDDEDKTSVFYSKELMDKLASAHRNHTGEAHMSFHEKPGLEEENENLDQMNRGSNDMGYDNRQQSNMRDSMRMEMMGGNPFHQNNNNFNAITKETETFGGQSRISNAYGEDPMGLDSQMKKIDTMVKLNSLVKSTADSKGAFFKDSEIFKQFKGPFLISDFSTYMGEVKNNEPNGQGRWISAQGDSLYEGEFLEGEKTGKGRLIMPSGDCYEGMFMQGKPQGRGCLNSVSENCTLLGDFSRGEFLKGRKSFIDGTYEEGTFRAGKLNGEGTHFLGSGDYIKGSFMKGLIQGQGNHPNF